MITYFKIFETLDYNIDVNSDIDMSYIDQLKHDLTFDAYKRANNVKIFKVKSITATSHMNKTVVLVTMINGDTISGIFNDADKSITININDDMVYDVDYQKFDINKLIYKISDEYKKYLKDRKYKFVKK